MLVNEAFCAYHGFPSKVPHYLIKPEQINIFFIYKETELYLNITRRIGNILERTPLMPKWGFL